MEELTIAHQVRMVSSFVLQAVSLMKCKFSPVSEGLNNGTGYWKDVIKFDFKEQFLQNILY